MRTAAMLPGSGAWPDPFPFHIAHYKRFLKRAWRDHYGDRCHLCDHLMVFTGGKSRRMPTIDHILARSMGGDNSLHNLQVICWLCNNSKSRKELGLIF